MFAAAMPTAAVRAAGVAFLMMMLAVVIAGGVLAKIQRARQQRGDCFVAAAADTAVQPDTRVFQRLPGTAADTAADYRVRAQLL